MDKEQKDLKINKESIIEGINNNSLNERDIEVEQKKKRNSSEIRKELLLILDKYKDIRTDYNLHQYFFKELDNFLKDLGPNGILQKAIFDKLEPILLDLGKEDNFFE